MKEYQLPTLVRDLIYYYIEGPYRKKWNVKIGVVNDEYRRTHVLRRKKQVLIRTMRKAYFDIFFQRKVIAHGKVKYNYRTLHRTVPDVDGIYITRYNKNYNYFKKTLTAYLPSGYYYSNQCGIKCIYTDIKDHKESTNGSPASRITQFIPNDRHESHTPETNVSILDLISKWIWK